MNSDIGTRSPVLSVVIPTLGRAELIHAVESLERQTLRDRIEVLVVGICEDEAVARFLREAMVRSPMIRHLPRAYPTGDSSRKKNDGWRTARAPIIAFMDDDAVAPPTWAERLLEPFEDPEVRVVSGPGRVPEDAPPFARWAGLALASRAAGYVAERYRGSNERPRPAIWSRIIGCNMAWRRSALEAIGGFDPAFWPGEEMIAAWRAVGRDASRLRIHPSAGVFHRPRGTPAAFWRQVAGYGATRIRLLRAGAGLEWPPLAPAVGGLTFLFLLAAVPWSAVATKVLVPGLATYGLFVAWAAMEMTGVTRRCSDIAVALVIPLMHLAYSWGSWHEILRPNRDWGIRSP